MKRILYASGGFVTDDAVADALMDYANVLAVIDSADVVRCVGVDDDGAVREIQLLIGPSSQIMAIGTDQAHAALDSAPVVEALRALAEERLPGSTDVGDAGDRPAESDTEAPATPAA